MFIQVASVVAEIISVQVWCANVKLVLRNENESDYKVESNEDSFSWSENEMIQLIIDDEKRWEMRTRWDTWIRSDSNSSWKTEIKLKKLDWRKSLKLNKS